MPQFHFQVRTETHVLVTDSMDLAGPDDARVEASHRAGQLLMDHAAQLWLDQEWRMDVTNEQGLILFVIHISASKSCAMTRERVRR